MRNGGRLPCFAVALMLTFAPAPAWAQASESAVKAAYLYKMAAFITWPPNAYPSASAPFRICVLNRSDVAGPLSQLTRGAQAWGRPVVVSQISSAQEASGCQILFLGDGRSGLSGSAPVLTVTDHRAPSPGVVEFAVQQSHVRFVIHRAQADERRLDISSKLLAVAAAVVP